jgi:hypothetical protein
VKDTEVELGIEQGAEVAAGNSAIGVVAVVGVGGVGSFGSERDCNLATGWTRMNEVFEVVVESQPWDGSRHVAAAARTQADDIRYCRQEKVDIEFDHSSRLSGELVEVFRYSSVDRLGNRRLGSLHLASRLATDSWHSCN